MVAIVGVRFFGLSRSVLLYASRLKLHSAIFAALTRLRTRLWEHFERVGMSDRRLLTSDSALRAMVADADDVRDLVPRTLFPPLVSALVVIGVSITAALLDVSSLGWFILLGAVNLVIVPILVIRAESRLASGIREDRNRILSVLTRALHAKDDLRTNRVESRVLGLVAGLESDLEAKQKASARNFGLAQLWLQLSTFTTAVILAASSGAPTEIVAVLSLMALGLGEVFASALEAFRQLPGLGTALDCLPDPDSAGTRVPMRLHCRCLRLKQRPAISTARAATRLTVRPPLTNSSESMPSNSKRSRSDGTTIQSCQDSTWRPNVSDGPCCAATAEPAKQRV